MRSTTNGDRRKHRTIYRQSVGDHLRRTERSGPQHRKVQKDNKIYDIVSEAEQTITENAQYKTDGLSLENQIRMTEFLKEYLLDPTKTNELIPGTLSINSPAINSQIEGYNTELQRYMKAQLRVRRTTRSFRISATDWLPHAGRSSLRSTPISPRCRSNWLLYERKRR